MRSGAKIAVCFVSALVITVSAIAIAMTGSTSQREAHTAFFFPYAMLTIYLRDGRVDVWFYLLGLSQFFIYGAFFAWAWVWGDDIRRFWARIIVLHLLLGIGCAALYSLN